MRCHRCLPLVSAATKVLKSVIGWDDLMTICVWAYSKIHWTESLYLSVTCIVHWACLLVCVVVWLHDKFSTHRLAPGSSVAQIWQFPQACCYWVTISLYLCVRLGVFVCVLRDRRCENRGDDSRWVLCLERVLAFQRIRDRCFVFLPALPLSLCGCVWVCVKSVQRSHAVD